MSRTNLLWQPGPAGQYLLPERASDPVRQVIPLQKRCSRGTVVEMSASNQERWVVTCDGSSLGNPGFGGWAWVVSSSEWACGGAAGVTNNQMELSAILEALRSRPETVKEVVVRSDSRYSIDALTKWVHGWRKRGWTTADGKSVANRELIEAILAEAALLRVRYEWVRGHSGDEWNEAADAHARRAALRAKEGEVARWGSGRRP